VQNLWIERHAKFFFENSSGDSSNAPVVDAPSSLPSLDRGANARKNARSPHFHARLDTVANAVHQYQESIAGRPYLIEVVLVSEDRWRAYIVRLPGVPTALMPFYGRTPDEAAHSLTAWLLRAHQRAGSGATG